MQNIIRILVVLVIIAVVSGAYVLFANQYEEEQQYCEVPPETTACDGMVWIPPGRFTMGSDAHYPEEYPLVEVTLDGFWISRFETTNEEYARFVEATGYRTVAEEALDPADYPDADPDMLQAASLVFVSPAELTTGSVYDWWQLMPGADWRHPTGPESNIRGKAKFPVVHVAFEDAQAYADWAGRSLPTEAQWERAARGGLDRQEFAWGNTRLPADQHLANTWQGTFPLINSQDDGYVGSAPVGCYPPNPFGLYDMIGNVWEWTVSWYAPEHDPGDMLNPQGPTQENSFDPRNPGLAMRVIKGGSFLCAPNYCRRYRPAARHAQENAFGTDHVGFRTVLNAAADWCENR